MCAKRTSYVNLNACIRVCWIHIVMRKPRSFDRGFCLRYLKAQAGGVSLQKAARKTDINEKRTIIGILSYTNDGSYLLLVYTLDIAFHIFMHIRPHPYRMRPDVHGFSHGLKSVHRTLFTPVCGLAPPFQIPSLH